MESVPARASRASCIAERVNRGLSHGAAADAIGISRNTLISFERGDAVRVATLKAIADYFECKVTDLVDVELDEAA